MSELLDFTIRIARQAGAVIRTMREEKDFTEQVKYGYELVTSADITSNELIISEIKKVFPGHRIISEESPNERFAIDTPTWIIDPIDGTVGFANGHYQVSVSIAYADKGQVLVGVVCNPFLDELFYAEKGKGAFLNGKPIHAKEVNDLKQCVIATGFPHKKENIPHILSYLERILPEIRDVRRMGSAALDLCWVACGRVQGYYEGSLSSWDMAAGLLIAREAGALSGRYAPLSGTALPDDIYGNHLIVASPGIFARMKAILDEGQGQM